MKALFKTTLFLLLLVGIAGLIGAGYWFYQGPPPEGLLETAEAAYDDGVAAMQAKNPQAALEFFKTTQANLDAINRAMQAKSTRLPTGAALHPFKGKTLYLWTRTARDRAYAQAALDGAPIPDSTDSISGATYRNFLVIPDANERQDVINALREAVQKVPGDPEVVQDALRTELMLQPMSWNFVHARALDSVRIDPNDPRALYLLARYEFEQPQFSANRNTPPPAPLEKRDRKRMRHALDFVRVLKRQPHAPLWRTVFLEAQIRHWLIEDSQRNHDDSDPADQMVALKHLLFDEGQGALPRAQRGDGMRNMSEWDAAAVLDIHPFALDVLASEGKKADVPHVVSVLRYSKSFCDKVSRDSNPPVAPDRAAAMLITVLQKTVPLLPVDQGAEWRAALETVKSSLGRDQQTSPSSFTCLHLAELLIRPTPLRVAKLGTEADKKLQKEALTWLKKGLALPSAQQLSLTNSVALHRTAAEIKWVCGGSRAELAPHLQALANSNQPAGEAFVRLLEGSLLEREGHLFKARAKFERAQEIAQGQQQLRASAALASLYLATGQYDEALASLALVEPVLARPLESNAFDRVWFAQYFRDNDDVQLMNLQANLATAQLKTQRFVRQSPSQKVPLNVVEAYEQAALHARESLTPRSEQERAARQLLAYHYAKLGRPEVAEKWLAELRRDSDEGTRLLPIEVAVRSQSWTRPLLPPTRVESLIKQREEVEALLEKKIKDYPLSHSARLLWVGWLANQGRYADANEYLSTRSNFLGNPSADVLRLLKLFGSYLDERAQPRPLLEFAPPDDFEITLVHLAAALEEKPALEAQTRYLRTAFQRLDNAQIALHTGKYKEAVELYAQAMECASMRSLGQGGLLQALFAYADAAPIEARILADQLLAAHEEEPTLLMGFAYASLLLEDFGKLDDSWAKRKNMSAAFNELRTLGAATVNERIRAGLTMARFARHISPLRAYEELQQNLDFNPNDPRTLAALLTLYQESPQAELQRERADWLGRLQRAEPDHPTLMYLQALAEHKAVKLQAAADTLEAMLFKHPHHSAGYAHLVSLYERFGGKGKAALWVRSWRVQNPDDVQGVAAEVRLLAQTNRVKDARMLLDQYVQWRVAVADKRLAFWTEITDPDAQQAKTRQVEEFRRSLRLPLLQGLMDGGDATGAEEGLRAVLKERPEDASFLIMLGDALLAQAKNAQAEALYKEVVAKDPSNQAAAARLARRLCERDQPIQALQILKEAQRNPTTKELRPVQALSADYYDALGLAGQKGVLLNDRKSILESAHKLYPDDPRVAFYLGEACAARGEHAEARRLYDLANQLAQANLDGILTSDQRLRMVKEIEASRKKLPGEK